MLFYYSHILQLILLICKEIRQTSHDVRRQFSTVLDLALEIFELGVTLSQLGLQAVLFSS